MPAAASVDLPDAPLQCPGCEIQLDSIATIGSSDSVEMLSDTKAVYLPDAHRIVVGPIGEQGRVAVFDEHGKFLNLLLRKGDGPSEVLSVKLMVPLAGDSLLIVSDAMKAIRISLSTGKGTDARLPIVTLNAMTDFGSGMVVMNAMADKIPNLVVLDSAMQPRLSFGQNMDSVKTDSLANDLDRLQLQLTRAPDGTLWTVTQRYELVLRQWSRDGRLLWQGRRQAAWFPQYHLKDRPVGKLASQVKIMPLITGVRVDSTRRVWLTAMVADSNWIQGDPEEPAEKLFSMGPNGRLVIAYREWDRFLDGIIEVIDPKSGRVVARRRLPFAMVAMYPDGLMRRSITLPSGDIEFRFYRARLVEQKRRARE
ncbi:MAG: hypothetical protein ABIS00_14570 [Gemmatimonadales bacterium]